MELREYLNWKRLTSKEFAGRVKLAPSYVSMILNGRQRPSMEAAIRIHRATGGQVTFDDLIGNELKRAKETA